MKALRGFLQNKGTARAVWLTGLTVLALFVGIGVTSSQKAAAATCYANNIIYCGYSTPSDFITKLKANDSNGHTDLQAFYSAFGLNSTDYARFASSAKAATVFSDGRVVVNGQVVQTASVNWGRNESYFSGTGMQKKVINGQTYYGNTTDKTFTESSFPGHVLFDANGTPEIVVLQTCGNPITGTRVQSGATCNMLHATQVAGQPNKYNFSTDASKAGLATITKYVYDFGDGTTQTTGSGSTISHVYTKPGDYKVKVTVYASAPGGNTIVVTAVNCTKVVNVPTPPFYACVQLQGATPKDLTYSFVAIARYGGGAEFLGADFDFGDGTTQTNVKPSGTTVSVQHTYAKAGSYDAGATLHFSVNGATVSAPTCHALVKPAQSPVPECKPGVPVGDLRCNPCQYNVTLTADDQRCTPQVAGASTELPNTGAGNVIAVASAALVAGFLFYRHKLFLKHKRAYHAAERATSPLPLGDPFAAKPLVGAAVSPAAKKPFTRRRQF